MIVIWRWLENWSIEIEPFYNAKQYKGAKSSLPSSIFQIFNFRCEKYFLYFIQVWSTQIFPAFCVGDVSAMMQTDTAVPFTTWLWYEIVVLNIILCTKAVVPFHCCSPLRKWERRCKKKDGGPINRLWIRAPLFWHTAGCAEPEPERANRSLTPWRAKFKVVISLNCTCTNHTKWRGRSGNCTARSRRRAGNTARRWPRGGRPRAAKGRPAIYEAAEGPALRQYFRPCKARRGKTCKTRSYAKPERECVTASPRVTLSRVCFKAFSKKSLLRRLRY